MTIKETQFLKIIQFQISNETLFVLDQDGVLWRNPLPIKPDAWMAIRLPSEEQHKNETRAEQARYDISHPFNAKARSVELNKLYTESSQKDT